MEITFLETDDFISIAELGKDGPFKKRNSDYFETLLKFECVENSLRAFHINKNEKEIGYLFFNIFHLEDNPKIYLLEIYLNDNDALSVAFEFAVDKIKEVGGESIVLLLDDTNIEELQLYKELGSVVTLEMIDSELELGNIGKVDINLEDIYQIQNFKELKKKWGENVFEKVLPIVKNVLMDIPGSEKSAKVLNLEMLKTSWSGAQFLEEGSLFILEGDKPIGIHNIVSLEDGDVTAGVTGILREYRRKGLMRALKTHGICWAKENGYKKFVSNNEKDNPMLQLNYQFGFKKVSSSFELRYEICSNP